MLKSNYIQNSIKFCQFFFSISSSKFASHTHRKRVGLGCVIGFRPIIRLWDLGLQGECPPWGSFSWILAGIYTSFRENHGKLRKAMLTSTTGNWTWHLPSTSFERRTVRPREELREREISENAKLCSRRPKTCNCFCSYKFLKGTGKLEIFSIPVYIGKLKSA